MARFTKSNSSRDSRSNSSRGGFGGRSSSTRGSRGQGSSRSRDSRGSGNFRSSGSRDSRDFEPKRFPRNRRDVKKTRVKCDSCGVECEVPFNPTSNKPVYCDDCFKKPAKSSKSNDNQIVIDNLEEELELVNKKLEKIMTFLGI